MPSTGRGTEAVYTQAGFGYRRTWVINEDRATTEDDDPPELVLHDRGGPHAGHRSADGLSPLDEQPTVINAAPMLTGSQEAVTRTVYLHAPRPPETSSHSGRLAVTFLTCFAGTTFIHRVNTVGGKAPAQAGTFVGQVAAVPYTADYFFYREANN